MRTNMLTELRNKIARIEATPLFDCRGQYFPVAVAERRLMAAMETKPEILSVRLMLVQDQIAAFPKAMRQEDVLRCKALALEAAQLALVNDTVGAAMKLAAAEVVADRVTQYLSNLPK